MSRDKVYFQVHICTYHSFGSLLEAANESGQSTGWSKENVMPRKDNSPAKFSRTLAVKELAAMGTLVVTLPVISRTAP